MPNTTTNISLYNSHKIKTTKDINNVVKVSPIDLGSFRYLEFMKLAKAEIITNIENNI